MVKTIKLTNKQSFKIDTTIWWLFIYRQQFGRDILPDLLPFIEAILKINASFIAPNGETGEMTTAQYLQALAKDEVLLNLASGEFSKMIDSTKINMINLDFKEEKD